MATRPKTDFAFFVRIAAPTAEISERLTPQQWDAPSICAGWKVKHLVAHQASGTTYSMPRMLGYVLKYRSQAAAGHQMALDMGDSLSQEEVIAEFRRGHADKPANLFVRLSDNDHGALDAAIHLQDLRRSVGDSGEIPKEIREVLFDLLPVTAGATNTKRVVEGLTLHATDLDRTTGSGPLVEGPFEAILMVAGGRKEALPELYGPGRQVIAERIGAA